MSKIFWHSLSSEEVIKRLESDIEKGLSKKQVKKKTANFWIKQIF